MYSTHTKLNVNYGIKINLPSMISPLALAWAPTSTLRSAGVGDVSSLILKVSVSSNMPSITTGTVKFTLVCPAGIVILNALGSKSSFPI